MAENITPKQALVMWCLLGRHGQSLQGELVPKVEKKDREALVAAGYISSSKLGQAFFLRVEDRGWRWAGEHLRNELPRNFQALHDWLTRVHEFLEREGKTVADFIGPAPEPSSESAEKKPRAAARKTSKAKRKKPPSAAQLRARIEQAYLAVTNGRKAEDALLSKVRAQLSDLDRATVDAGLLQILQGDEKARLGRINDPRTLTPEERDAAFNPGGEPFHLLWIQP